MPEASEAVKTAVKEVLDGAKKEPTPPKEVAVGVEPEPDPSVEELNSYLDFPKDRKYWAERVSWLRGRVEDFEIGRANISKERDLAFAAKDVAASERLKEQARVNFRGAKWLRKELAKAEVEFQKFSPEGTNGSGVA